MKKTYALSLLSIMACSCQLSAWQPFVLDQRVTVKLPHQPRLVETRDLPQVPYSGRAQVWRLFTKTGDYQLTRTVAKHFATRDTTHYAYLVALLQKAGAHDIVLHRFTTGSIAGQDITYYTTHSTPTYIRCFSLDSVRYAAAFFPARELDATSSVTAEQRDNFFNSITIKP
jgi:hypothetical protein